MATSITPKSEMRLSANIVVGYAEVPSTIVEGIQGWGLPGGKVTFSEQEALAAAINIDKEIRARMSTLGQLYSRKPLWGS